VQKPSGIPGGLFLCFHGRKVYNAVSGGIHMVERKEELLKFSKWIRSQLFNRAMTARDLSLLSGVDESEISKLTRAVRWPSLRIIKMIAPHLKWDPYDFLVATGLDMGVERVGSDEPRKKRRYSKEEVDEIVKKVCMMTLDVIE
jgi:hypothetical protein